MAKDVESCEWTVTGMDCGACANKVKTAVDRLPGVQDVNVAIMSERLRLTLDEGVTPRKDVEAAVKSLGYGIAPKGAPVERKGFVLPEATSPDGLGFENEVHPDGNSGSESHQRFSEPRTSSWYQTPKGRLVVLTGGLLILAWVASIFTSAELGHWAFITACLVGVAPVAKRAAAALRMGQPFTIESLMTIAATGALFIGAAEEAALVVFLFAVGEVLEGVAANKARDGIRALTRLVPKTALLEVGGDLNEVPAESLAIGQIVVVRPGDRIPADGEIVEGTSGIDESPITGESVPVAKSINDDVFAGSVNTEAVLRIRVTREAEDNTIARIIHLVEEAESSRAPTERFIDRFSRWYMPAIVGLAILVMVVPPIGFEQSWDTWIYRGLALLLIGCPCALVISVPASIASAMSSGARHGLLMKGGAVIEAAAAVQHVAFDKTGTLTHGTPRVTDIVPFGDYTERNVLELAATIEAGSSHPLAQAILDRATSEGISLRDANSGRAIPGKGVEATVDGNVSWVSNPDFAENSGVLDDAKLSRAVELEGEGKTTVVVFQEQNALGLIAMRDEAREDAKDAIAQLKAMNVGATMLTGDNERTAAAIADSLGIEAKAQMLPQDKLMAIKELGKRGGVMMIGDGINDAPALKQATVGVAMGSGTDVALESADAAILRDRVTDVVNKIRLARTTMANIRQNITIALGLKAVFLVTSVLGITGLWIAIMADTGATVLVTLNALRLLTYNPDRSSQDVT